MARIRYRVYDLPTVGTGAFVPIPFTNPIASSWGLVKVFGSPGTMPIPRPKRNSLIPISQDPKTQTTNCSPDVGFPDIYIPYADNMGPAIHVNMAGRRMTPIPVPAVSWINTALQAIQASRAGGRIAAAWPRAFQRWATYGEVNKRK